MSPDSQYFPQYQTYPVILSSRHWAALKAAGALEAWSLAEGMGMTPQQADMVAEAVVKGIRRIVEKWAVQQAHANEVRGITPQPLGPEQLKRVAEQMQSPSAEPVESDIAGTFNGRQVLYGANPSYTCYVGRHEECGTCTCECHAEGLSLMPGEVWGHVSGPLENWARIQRIHIDAQGQQTVSFSSWDHSLHEWIPDRFYGVDWKSIDFRRIYSNGPYREDAVPRTCRCCRASEESTHAAE